MKNYSTVWVLSLFILASLLVAWKSQDKAANAIKKTDAPITLHERYLITDVQLRNLLQPHVRKIQLKYVERGGQLTLVAYGANDKGLKMTGPEFATVDDASVYSVSANIEVGTVEITRGQLKKLFDSQLVGRYRRIEDGLIKPIYLEPKLSTTLPTHLTFYVSLDKLMTVPFEANPSPPAKPCETECDD
jgi:hypothetical protein